MAETMTMAWDQLLLGQAHPAVVQALINAAPQGSHFGQSAPAELEGGVRL